MSRAGDFWSRRKARVQAEAEAEAQEALATAERARQADLAARPDQEVLAELGLPEPESLRAGDDFSVFLGKAVPGQIRRRALRRLWGTNPALACLDGLNDYDDDYTDAATSAGTLRTAYRVGRGLLDRPAPPRQSPECRGDAAEAETGPSAPEMAEAPAGAPLPATDPVPDQPAPDQIAEAAETTRSPRRMRFTFAEAAGPLAIDAGGRDGPA